MTKHIKYLIPIFIISFFLAIPNVFAAENVTIESATLTDKSDGVSEVSEPTINGLNIGFDLSYSQVNDYAKYKVVINNPTSEDYEVSKNKEFTSSDYLTYTYDFDVDSNVVKSKEKLIMYITITYKAAVPSDKLTDGKYIETNSAIINLSNDSINVPDTIKNPNTGDKTMIVICILLISIGVLLILYKTTKKRQYLNIMILSLVLIPVGAYALEKLQVNVTTKVTLEEKYPVNYIIYETIKTSEKSNYDIFDFNSFGVEEASCRAVEGQDGYEFCAIIESKKMYSPGETVTLPDEITYHVFNGNGELIENTVPMNSTEQEGIWDYYLNDTTLSTNQFDIWYWWAYNKDLNNYDDVNEMNFTGNIYDNLDSNCATITLGLDSPPEWDSSCLAIELDSPNTFTMPRHDVFFLRRERLWIKPIAW